MKIAGKTVDVRKVKVYAKVLYVKINGETANARKFIVYVKICKETW